MKENALSPPGKKAADRQIFSITFQDVAGNDAEKEQLWDIVDFLRHPEIYRAQGATLPKGVLLTGPPGVGKTLLAKSVAGEAHVPFFAASGSDFQEVYVGVGAQRVRQLFARAKEAAPSIIFIDEFDALARKRDGAHEESARTLNALLTEMDGFSTMESIVVIAATNFPELLDAAATRPGRFDRVVDLMYPDRVAREQILRVHLRNKKALDVDLADLSRKTAGMTGAHLATILNEAAILAVKDRTPGITQSHIDEALARVVAGLKHTRVDPAIRTRIAIHEAGHAIVALALHRPIDYVTIEPRGKALGYVFYSERRDELLLTEEDLESEVLILLGGRAAEWLILHSRSTGAANDLERAAQLLRNMLCKYGMGEAIWMGSNHADEELARRLEMYHQRAEGLIERYRGDFDELVNRLLRDEVVSGQTILFHSP